MPTFAHTDPLGPVAAPAWLRDAVARLEADARLDRVGRVIAGVASPLASSPVAPYLRGEAVGHSLHPAIATLRIGVFGSSLVLDVVGGRSGRVAARRLAAVGVALSVPVALTGLTEYADVADDDDEVRRVGALYLVANALAGMLFFRSWRSRRRGHGLRGLLWSLAGAAPTTAALYLGAHLTQVWGFCGGPRGLDAPVARTRPTPVETTWAEDDPRTTDVVHEDDGSTTPHTAIRAL